MWSDELALPLSGCPEKERNKANESTEVCVLHFKKAISHEFVQDEEHTVC